MTTSPLVPAFTASLLAPLGTDAQRSPEMLQEMTAAVRIGARHG